MRESGFTKQQTIGLPVPGEWVDTTNQGHTSQKRRLFSCELSAKGNEMGTIDPIQHDCGL